MSILLAIFYLAYFWKLIVCCLGIVIGFLVAVLSERSRVGAFIAIGSLALLAWWGTLPERSALMNRIRGNGETQRSALSPADRPRALVIHEFTSLRIGSGMHDAITLAETGLFDVYLAQDVLTPKIIGRVEVGRFDDCIARRVNDDAKLGALVFAAQTGFERCGKVVAYDGPAPERRMDLWTHRPPGWPWPGSRGYEDLRGVIKLSLTENGTERVISLREKRARVSEMSRWGIAQYEDRRPNSKISSWKQYDPDLLSLVFEVLGLDLGSYRVPDALTGDELVQKAAAVGAEMERTSPKTGVRRLDVQTHRVAAAFVGAAEPTGVDEVLRAVGQGLVGERILSVRVPSDCPTARRVDRLGQVLGQACMERSTKRFPNSSRTCHYPLDVAEYEERCLLPPS